MNKEFEKWATGRKYDLAVDDGGYEDVETEAASDGYQARQPEIDALKAENVRLRKDAEHVCKAAEGLQNAVNELWKSNNPDELSEDDKAIDPEEALELHGEAWKELDTAVYYMRKGMSALPDTKGE